MVSGMKGCGFRILDSGTCIANSNRWRDSRFHELNSGFKAQAGFRIPQAKISWTVSESVLTFMLWVIF